MIEGNFYHQSEANRHFRHSTLLDVHPRGAFVSRVSSQNYRSSRVASLPKEARCLATEFNANEREELDGKSKFSVKAARAIAVTRMSDTRNCRRADSRSKT
jgi:hypothetical protein